MEIKRIADSASYLAYFLTHNWKYADEAYNLVLHRADSRAIEHVNKQVEERKQELFKQFLHNKLGYTPSDAVINFIKEFKL